MRTVRMHSIKSSTWSYKIRSPRPRKIPETATLRERQRERESERERVRERERDKEREREALKPDKRQSWPPASRLEVSRWQSNRSRGLISSSSPGTFTLHQWHVGLVLTLCLGSPRVCCIYGDAFRIARNIASGMAAVPSRSRPPCREGSRRSNAKAG